MSRKAIPKKIREQVYNKYNGHCAYCGCELAYKDMQVDHIESVFLTEYKGCEVDNSIANLMPACRQCNFYKSVFSIEYFRKRIAEKLMPNLQKTFNYRLALKYGLIKEDIKPIVFYFEMAQRKE